MPLPGALAYVDPMSGAIVLQLIIAAAVGCGAFFRRSIWGFFSRLFRGKRPPQEPSE